MHDATIGELHSPSQCGSDGHEAGMMERPLIDESLNFTSEEVNGSRELKDSAAMIKMNVMLSKSAAREKSMVCILTRER